MIDIHDCVTSFEDYVEKTLSLSFRVTQRHIRNITLFEHFVIKNNLIELIDATDTVRSFIDHCNTSNKAIYNIMTSLNHFYQHLMLRNLIKSNPISKITRPERDSKYHQYISYATIQKIINTPDDSYTIGLRDKTIFTLLYNTGMRVNEVCKLTIPDIDITNALIRVKSKGNERLIPLHQHAIESLKRYLDKRPILAVRNTPYLFINNRGKQLRYATLRARLSRYIDKAKLTQPFSTHSFRHAYASHLIMAGADIRVVQFLLGHRSIHATQIYVQLHQNHLKKLHKKHHPRSTFAKLKELDVK